MAIALAPVEKPPATLMTLLLANADNSGNP